MIIEEALYAYLSTNAGVVAIAGTRGFPLEIPEDAALPAWCYQRISGPREMAHSGPQGIAAPRFQFTCKAATYSAAKSLATAIRTALDGYQGVMGGAGGVQVFGAFIKNDADELTLTTKSPFVRMDAIIWHKET